MEWGAKKVIQYVLRDNYSLNSSTEYSRADNMTGFSFFSYLQIININVIFTCIIPNNWGNVSLNYRRPTLQDYQGIGDFATQALS